MQLELDEVEKGFDIAKVCRTLPLNVEAPKKRLTYDRFTAYRSAHTALVRGTCIIGFVKLILFPSNFTFHIHSTPTITRYWPNATLLATHPTQIAL